MPRKAGWTAALLSPQSGLSGWSAFSEVGQGAWVVQTGRCGCLRWVGGGGCQRGGVDLGIGSDGFFDHTGTDPGRARWSPTINAKVRELGLVVNASGDLVNI